jgi:hypothetical protein
MYMYRRVVAYTSQILTQGRLLPAEMERKILLDWALRYDELYRDSLVRSRIHQLFRVIVELLQACNLLNL